MYSHGSWAWQPFVVCAPTQGDSCLLNILTPWFVFAIVDIFQEQSQKLLGGLAADWG
jgi:hypothetical protein